MAIANNLLFQTAVELADALTEMQDAAITLCASGDRADEFEQELRVIGAKRLRYAVNRTRAVLLAWQNYLASQDNQGTKP